MLELLIQANHTKPQTLVNGNTIEHSLGLMLSRADGADFKARFSHCIPYELPDSIDWLESLTNSEPQIGRASCRERV